MAKHYRPRRSLLILGLVLAGLATWAFLPNRDHSPKLGLDLRGGTQVILSPQSANSSAVTSDQMAQTLRIIRQRVDGFGVAEAQVQVQGSGANTKIIVTIPGTTSRAVVDQLKTTAKMSFRPVVAMDYGTPKPGASASPSASGKATAAPTPTPTVDPALLVPPIQSKTITKEFANVFGALDCAKNSKVDGAKPDDETQYLIACDKDGAYKYVLAPSLLSGTDVQSASAGLPQSGAGNWQIDLTMSTSGAKKFADATKALYKQKAPANQFGIVLDGVVMSAPSVNEPILGGNAVISGNFTAEEAKALSQVLKFGSLPVSLSVDEVQQISPTLGSDQLHAGILAGAFGLLLVILYLLAYYSALGILATFSLIVAAAFTYLIVVILGNEIHFTMTLAGIAGAIVAIGITADSFVVYFERLRDELREGKRLRSAADHGWGRARRTILAADFVSLLAAVVLYYLSVGSVRGFAFTLGLTTVIDVLVAFMFTRPLVYMAAESRWMNAGSSWTGVSPARLGVVSKTEAAQ